jgi:hypothetical protein
LRQTPNHGIVINRNVVTYSNLWIDDNVVTDVAVFANLYILHDDHILTQFRAGMNLVTVHGMGSFKVVSEEIKNLQVVEVSP